MKWERVSDTDKEILNRKAPEVGALVLVRSRRWLVEEVKTNGNGSPLVRLACADDDAQGSYVMGPPYLGDASPDQNLSVSAGDSAFAPTLDLS